MQYELVYHFRQCCNIFKPCADGVEYTIVRLLPGARLQPIVVKPAGCTGLSVWKTYLSWVENVWSLQGHDLKTVDFKQAGAVLTAGSWRRQCVTGNTCATAAAVITACCTTWVPSSSIGRYTYIPTVSFLDTTAGRPDWLMSYNLVRDEGRDDVTYRHLSTTHPTPPRFPALRALYLLSVTSDTPGPTFLVYVYVACLYCWWLAGLVALLECHCLCWEAAVSCSIPI